MFFYSFSEPKMYRKIFILIVCISIIFVNTKVTEEPVRNDFQQQLKSLDSVQNLEVFDHEVYQADVNNNTDIKNLSRWFCMSLSFEGMELEKKALSKLKEESFDVKTHNQPELFQGVLNMSEAFKNARDYEDNCMEGLLFAECRAVTMYTSDFYLTYNNNTRKGYWEPYRIFTTLLYGAQVKLAKMFPILANTKLYRGTKRKLNVSGSNRFYFKHFVSTSLDKKVAEKFGTETLMVFHDVLILAAGIENLSMYKKEREVLISPFEAFELISQNGSQLNFKSAKKQDFISNDKLQCANDSNKNIFIPPTAAGVGVLVVLLIS